jgi:hypothetical protein
VCSFLSIEPGDNLMYIKAESLQTVNNLLDDNYPQVYRQFFKEVSLLENSSMDVSFQIYKQG